MYWTTLLVAFGGDVDLQGIVTNQHSLADQGGKKNILIVG